MLGLAALNTVFVAVVLSWLMRNPMNRAPDEGIHFEQNVKFIIEQGRLPVAGQDARQGDQHEQRERQGGHERLQAPQRDAQHAEGHEQDVARQHVGEETDRQADRAHAVGHDLDRHQQRQHRQ